MVDEIQQKRRQYILRCFACKTEFNIDDYGKFYRCAKCGNLLEIRRIANLSSSKSLHPIASYGVWKYFDLLPIWNRVTSFHSRKVVLLSSNVAILRHSLESSRCA